jgi:hypothetical protein
MRYNRGWCRYVKIMPLLTAAVFMIASMIAARSRSAKSRAMIKIASDGHRHGRRKGKR